MIVKIFKVFKRLGTIDIKLMETYHSFYESLIIQMLLIFDNHELAHEVILMRHILKYLF